jgi:alpha-tubulin suppressor-like RCC1 family protein
VKRGAPALILLVCLVSGCLDLLGGHGVPTPSDAGSHPKPGAAVSVSSGGSYQTWCAVTANGDVECWGDNEVGELGNGTTTQSSTPVKVKGLPEAVTLVSVGYTFVCALTKSGRVFCWGYGGHGEIGDGKTTEINPIPIEVKDLGSGVISLSGGLVPCAIKQDGSAWCWGEGQTNLLGNGQTTDALVPVPVRGMTSSVTSISVGDWAACAVQRGRVLCWGAFDHMGELGNGTTDASLVPVAVDRLPSGITSVTVGTDYACALTAGEGVMCWGDGTNGALGNDDEAVSPAPVEVTGLSHGVTAVSAGSLDVCALKEDGGVVCWGYGGDGELGNGPLNVIGGCLQIQATVPLPVKGLSGPATAISTGSAPCAVTTAGSVECWGITSEYALTPVPVTGLGEGITGVSVGGGITSLAFACAVDTMGMVKCWGSNIAGQLGNGTTEESGIPVMNANIVSGGTWVGAGIEGNFACGVDSGLVMCWGSNYSGQLGNGATTTEPVKTPVAVHGLKGVAAVATGAASACALTTAGGVFCWGDNTYGELGNASTTSSGTPVPVQGLASGVMQVSVGSYSACALLMDGTVDCWGDNHLGQLGNGTTMISTAPAPVSGLGAAKAVAMGWFSACAATSAGTLQCWGDNTFGELGNDTTTSSLVPVPLLSVPGGASSVAVGEGSACAIVDGGAMCWGSPAGGLGIGPANGYVLVPTQVVGLTAGVTDITVGEASTCAVVDGGVRCWGNNTAGQLGNGGAVDEFQATPVPGFP